MLSKTEREKLRQACWKAANDVRLTPEQNQNAKRAYNNLTAVIKWQNIITRRDEKRSDQTRIDSVGEAANRIEATKEIVKSDGPAAHTNTSTKKRDARHNLIEQLARRMEILLLDETNPQHLMADILSSAVLAGLICEPWTIRQNKPDLFVMDLLTENPNTLEWMNFASEWIKPLAISDSAELIEKIRPA